MSEHIPTIDEPQAKKRNIDDTTQDSTLAPVASLLIKRLSDKARLPTRGSPLSAGYDLYRYATRRVFPSQPSHIMSSAEEKVIPAHGKALVDTQISIAVPAGTYGRVAPRSGLGQSRPLLRLATLLTCSVV